MSEQQKIWTPQPKQRLFMSAPDFEVLYGGAAGGGKSDALLMEGLRQIENKNYKGIIFRRTYQQLEELIDKSNRFIGAAVPGARYNASAHTWTFPSGAKLLLRQMERDADRYKYQGHEYQYIGFDELTHFSFAQYSYLMSRCRSADPTLRCYVRASTNPGGVGHGWVKDRFIDSMKPYERKWDLIRVGDIKMLRSRMFIPATIFDNKKLLESDPEYLANLGALPEADRRALLYGDWNSFDGQVFREFKDDPAHYDDHRWTHVINEFEIPQDWKIMRAYDFGYSKPFSVGWYAINHDGTIFRIAELYGCNGTPNVGLQWDAGRQAREIAETEATLPNLKDRVITGVADPAIFEESHGESIAEIMRREGILFEPGDHQRIAGKMQIHSRLAFDANGRAGLYFFRNCRNMIRTLPALCYDAVRVEDIDSDMEDHAYDELRYLCMERPMAAPLRVPKPQKTFDPLGDSEFQAGAHLEYYRRRA